MFEGTLLAEPDGGHAVVVPDDVRAQLGGSSRLRVRGTINGTPFRSNIVTYSGILYLGVHKATVRTAGLIGGDVVTIEIEADPDPR
ncbi:MAG: DUF1905 domain-containing protein [Bacteroidetes bacterium]|nr:DUF1905 domain-containing protein [Bacteroidota bacterium]